MGLRGVSILPMEVEHLPIVREIEQASFPTPWPENAYDNELKNNRVARYLVAQEGDRTIGYGGMWLILDEAHITTMAVQADRRRRSIGKWILWELLILAVSKGCKWVTLEVRETNEVALNLYKSFGFTQVGVRKEYYEGDENAVVMWAGNLQGKAFAERMDHLKSGIEALEGTPGTSLVERP